jgi:hypothetical protein
MTSGVISSTPPQAVILLLLGFTNHRACNEQEDGCSVRTGDRGGSCSSACMTPVNMCEGEEPLTVHLIQGRQKVASQTIQRESDVVAQQGVLALRC